MHSSKNGSIVPMGRCTFSGSKEIKCDDKSPLDPQITKWKCKHKAQTKTTSCKTLSKWPCFGLHLFACFTIEAASGQWGALTYYFLIRARVGSHLDGDWMRFIWESSHSLLRKPLHWLFQSHARLPFFILQVVQDESNSTWTWIQMGFYR